MPAGSPRLRAGLPPLSGEDPVVLILGSFPSRISLETGQYYANKKNQFWKVMEVLLGICHTLPYQQRTGLLVARRIALWDAVASCRRTGSADSRIEAAAVNPVPSLLASRPGIRLIACNGSASFRYLEGTVLPEETRIIRLPSTSPANARVSFHEKCRSWSVIQDYL